MTQSRVSCIMPTYGRPDFVAQSVAMFLAQDYAEKELIILNDCPGQVLKCQQPDVKVINSSSRWATLGEKRNAAIELASGDYIAVWDDDDVYLPWRLSYSMSRIAVTGSQIYCPAEFWAYWGEEELHNNAAVPGWVCHPLIIFRKDVWKAVGGYPKQTLGEDAVFLATALSHLGSEWIRDEISRFDRLMIMRCKSKYSHTSISGGSNPPNTASGEFDIVPEDLDDPLLSSLTKNLISRRNDEQRRAAATLLRRREDLIGNDQRSRVWLDQLELISHRVGYGDLGLGGNLGYSNRRVEINGIPRPHSFSAHAPSVLEIHLDGQQEWFCCDVALNDDVPLGATAADFMVFGDGRLCGIAKNVRPGQMPRQLNVDVAGINHLKLVVQHYQWDNCHAVWVDPFVIPRSRTNDVREIRDALGRASIRIPEAIPECDLCIMTVGSAGFEEWVDDLFGSVLANAQCPNAMLAVYSLGDSEEIRCVAEKYSAVVIPCDPLASLSVAVKSVMYTAGRVIRAKKFICLDADMLVLDELRSLSSAIDSVHPADILACREAKWAENLGIAIKSIYGGNDADLRQLTCSDGDQESRYSLVVNDGILAGSAVAFCALDDGLRGLHAPDRWLDDSSVYIPWRNQFLLNIALAQGNCGVELDPRFNVQLQLQSVEVHDSGSSLSVTFGGSRRATIIHFNGASRGSYPEIRGKFRKVARPLVRRGGSNQPFEVFLTALRRWLGGVGRDALAWSFYGTPDGSAGIDCDSCEFPLLNALYSLIRSNGCCKVIETGTARGISAACLASAVSDRPSGVITTLDIQAWPERDLLWNQLPFSVRTSICPRQFEAIEGLRSALDSGETYDAALLDSVHTAEHVLQEFEYASQLVCRGGLILIHDATWPYGTVGAALDEIDRRGYGVTRLWTAESGCPQDAGLGLAIIENRLRLRS